MMVKQKICQKCGGNFPNHIYHNGKRVTLQRRKYCLDCSPYGKHNTRQLEKPVKKKRVRSYPYDSERVNKKRHENKVRAITYLGGKCSKCGFVGSLRCYDFHHTDQDEKEYQIAFIILHSWSKIKNELDKCILVCGNCHMELHDIKYPDTAQNRHALKYRKKSVMYLGGSCVKCGYKDSLRALCFHHRNLDEKKFEINGAYNYSWKRIQEELDKCDLMCINCHRELHHS